MTATRIAGLKLLEAESIEIMREAVAAGRKPVMMYSIGKDSSVMLHLAMKAFHPAPPPFPLLHVDTTWKFRDMYAHRARVAAESGMRLIVHTNRDGLKAGINPFSHGSSYYTDVMKTQALVQALDEYRFDIVFGGARRDEEKSRAKERVFPSARRGIDGNRKRNARTLESLQHPCSRGRKHSRVPDIQLDGDGCLAIHPSGKDFHRAALLRQTTAGGKAWRNVDHG